MSSMADAGVSHAPYPQGTVVAGRFALETPLAGAPGVAVYRARDNQSGADVTLLLVPLDRVGGRQATLHADLGRVARVAHKNLGRIVAFGAEGGMYHVASEHPDGHPLRSAIAARQQQGQAVGAQAAFAILGHIAAGLSAAYAAMAHGALNPNTVVVGREGQVVLEHLGVFQGLTEIAWRGISADAGSPYVAPELAGGGLPTAAADVYSMGAMLYEMLTGQAPLAPLAPPSQITAVPSLVDAVVAKALSTSPLSRQGSPQMLVNELGAALGLGDSGGGLASGGLPQATGGFGLPRVTGRTFNVAKAAGLDVDAERWLVQKGKLDFGPFTMNQLKAELHKGTFSGNHLLTDTETGEQTRIKEHPQLGEFAKQAERSLEHARRLKADQSLEHSERNKSRTTLMVSLAGLAVVIAGLAFYLVNRENRQEGALASRAEEADIDAFLKNVKIEFNQVPKARVARRSGSGASKAGDDFNSDLVLGDVSKGGGDAVLDDNTIQRVMMGNYRKLVPCIMEAKVSAIDLEFVIRGSGDVSAVKVNGEQKGSLPSCVLGRMKSFPFPKFDGAKTIASWSMAVR